MIKSESDIFETRFFDTYVSCSLTFVLYTSGNVQLFGLQDSRDSQNHGFGIPGSPWTHGPPRLPISQILGVLGVPECRLPRLPLPSKWGYWESRESGLRDSQYSQNLGYWESRESRESQTMYCKKRICPQNLFRRSKKKKLAVTLPKILPRHFVFLLKDLG